MDCKVNLIKQISLEYNPKIHKFMVSLHNYKLNHHNYYLNHYKYKIRTFNKYNHSLKMFKLYLRKIKLVIFHQRYFHLTKKSLTPLKINP